MFKSKLEMRSRLLPLIYILVLLVMVFVYYLHTSGLRDIGGDDSRLYFLYSDIWGKVFSLKSWRGYLGGYNPQFSYLGISYFSNFFKTIVGINRVQGLLRCVILLLTFTASFWFFRESFEKGVGEKNINLSLLGALYYTFSPLLFYLFWPKPLAAIFGLIAFPLLGVLLLKVFFSSSLNNVIKVSVLFGFILIPFNVALSLAPFILGMLLVLFMFYVSLIVFYPKKLLGSLLRFFVSFGILMFFNMYWALPYLHALAGRQVVSFVSSGLGTRGGISTVNILSSQVTIRESLILLLSSDLVLSNMWPIAEVYSNFSFLTIGLYINYLVLILGVYYFFRNRKSLKSCNHRFYVFYIVGLIVSLFSLFLFTAGPGFLGRDLYILLVRYIPGWVMFRNFFNKFAIPYALFYILLLMLNLFAINKFLVKSLYNALVSIFLIIIILNSLPFILGRVNMSPMYVNSNMQGSKERYSDTNIPKSYMSMVASLSSIRESTRILYFPLSYASWSIVEGEKDSDSVYVGLSPISSFTHTDDFNGEFAFNTANRYIPGIKNSFVDSLYYKDTDSFKKILNILGIKYVVVNKKIYQDSYKDVYEKYAWGEYNFQTLDNVNSVLNDPSFTLVKSYGPENTLLLYKFTDGVGKFNFLDRLVSYTDTSVSDLINTSYYSKNTGFIRSEDVTDALSSTVVADIVGTEKYNYDLGVFDWNKGWSWPEANNKPTSFKYPLVRLKEYITYLKERDDIKKIDLQIWYMAKRAQEYQTYGQGVSKGAFNKSFSATLQTIKNLDQENPNFEGLVSQFVSYTERSITKERSLITDKNFDKYQVFKNTFLKKCLYDVCFDSPILSKGYVVKELKGRKDSSKDYFVDGVPISSINDFNDLLQPHQFGINYKGDNLAKKGSTVPLIISESKKTNFVALAEFLKKNILLGSYHVTPLEPNTSYLLSGELKFSSPGAGIAVFEVKEGFPDNNVSYSLVYNRYEDVTSFISISKVFKTSKQPKFYIIFIYSGDDAIAKSLISNTMSFKKIDDTTLLFVKDNLNNPLPTNCDINYSKKDVESYKIHSNCSPTIITMNDSFHKGWVLTENTNQNKLQKVISYLKKEEPVGEHFIVNGYANAWYLNGVPKKGLLVEFKPRVLFYIGTFISILSVSVSVIYLVYFVITNDRVKSIVHEFYTRYFRR